MEEKLNSAQKKIWPGLRRALRRLSLIALVLLPLSWTAYAFLVKSWKPLDGTEESTRHFVEWMVILSAAIAVTFWASLLTLPRWLQRLFCWRNLSRLSFGLACFATLIALIYAEENWRGKHDWEKYKREWEAKGEKFDLADFVPPAVPDDQNFALTPVVFTCYGSMLTRNGKFIPYDKRDTNFINRLQMSVGGDDSGLWPTNGLWASGRKTDLRGWQKYYRALASGTNLFPVSAQAQPPAADVLLALSKYDSTIEELRQASHLPESRFPLEYDKEDPAEILLPHLGALKHCGQVLQLRAIAELENDKSEKSFADIQLALRLADSVHTEPIIITHLVRIAILEMTLQPVWEGLAEHKWSDAQLAAFDSDLAKLDFLADYEFSVRSERAAHIKIVDWMERKRSRFWELFNMVNGDERNVMKQFGLPVEIYLMPRGWYYQSEIRLSKVQQQWALPMVNDLQQTVLPQAARESVDAVKSLRPTGVNLFARLLLPELGNYAKKVAHGQTSANLARVAIALERYRFAHVEFPDSLDALVPQFMKKIPHDIIGGQPLHYHRTDDGRFVLYSVGWNETDDGGQIVFLKNKKKEPRDENSSSVVNPNEGDWAWKYPARTE